MQGGSRGHKIDNLEPLALQLVQMSQSFYDEQLHQFLSRLNEERIDRGIKVSRIAEKTGMDYTIVMRMLKGEIKHPTFVKVVLLAKFFEKDLSEIIRDPVSERDE